MQAVSLPNRLLDDIKKVHSFIWTYTKQYAHMLECKQYVVSCQFLMTIDECKINFSFDFEITQWWHLNTIFNHIESGIFITIGVSLVVHR